MRVSVGYSEQEFQCFLHQPRKSCVVFTLIETLCMCRDGGPVSTNMGSSHIYIDPKTEAILCDISELSLRVCFSEGSPASTYHIVFNVLCILASVSGQTFVLARSRPILEPIQAPGTISRQQHIHQKQTQNNGEGSGVGLFDLNKLRLLPLCEVVLTRHSSGTKLELFVYSFI